jgi:hypothetical protein
MQTCRVTNSCSAVARFEQHGYTPRFVSGPAARNPLVSADVAVNASPVVVGDFGMPTGEIASLPALSRSRGRIALAGQERVGRAGSAGGGLLATPDHRIRSDRGQTAARRVRRQAA